MRKRGDTEMEKGEMLFGMEDLYAREVMARFTTYRSTRPAKRRP